MDNPLTGLAWVSSRHGRPAPAADLLRGLGRADIELSHDAFHRLQPWRAAAHLRELLMQCGVLPPIDKQILLFERWLLEHLDTTSDTEQRRLLRQYATWYLLPWLRRRAERGPVSRSSRSELGQQVLRAGDSSPESKNSNSPSPGSGRTTWTAGSSPIRRVNGSYSNRS